MTELAHRFILKNAKATYFRAPAFIVKELVRLCTEDVLGGFDNHPTSPFTTLLAKMGATLIGTHDCNPIYIRTVKFEIVPLSKRLNLWFNEVWSNEDVISRVNYCLHIDIDLVDIEPPTVLDDETIIRHMTRLPDPIIQRHPRRCNNYAPVL